MARYRRSYRRPRRPMNTTWQPWYIRNTIAVPSSATEGQNFNGLLAQFVPGLGDSGDPQNITPFEDDHVLERVRGAMSHNGRSDISSGTLGSPIRS